MAVYKNVYMSTTGGDATQEGRTLLTVGCTGRVQELEKWRTGGEKAAGEGAAEPHPEGPFYITAPHLNVLVQSAPLRAMIVSSWLTRAVSVDLRPSLAAIRLL